MRLLLIEDEPFIALDLELIASAHGHEVVGVAADAAAALVLAEQFQPHAALVDINLRDGRTGVDVCRRLVAAHDLKAAFVTGNAEEAPDDLAGALALVEKPYSESLIAAALGLLERAVQGAAQDFLVPGMRLPRA